MKIIMLIVLVASSSVFGQQMTLSLEEAIQLANDQNQMLKVARARMAEAKGAKMKSYAGFLPSVRVTEGWYRSNDAVNAFGTRLRQEAFTQADFEIARLNFPPAITNWQTKLEIRQPVFNGGSSIAGGRAASRMVDAARAELRQAENETRFHTAQAYWGVVLAEKAMAAVIQGLASARSHAKSAEAAYGQEMIPLPDLLAARLRVAELEENEIEAANRSAQALESLTLIVGIDIGSDVTVSDSLRISRIDSDVASLVKTALKRRPDLIASRKKLEAAREGTRRARGNWLPHLNAFFEGSLDSDEWTSRQGESWTVGALVTWDLFAGGRTIGEMQEARAKRDQAAEALVFFEAAAVREVHHTYREVTAAARRIVIAESAVEQASERLRITELQYREGLATTSDLLDSEATLTQTRLRRARALHDLNVGKAKLVFVTGVEASDK